jgi:hypothetical protein
MKGEATMCHDSGNARREELLANLHQLHESGEMDKLFKDATENSEKLLDQLKKAQVLNPEVLRKQVTI